MRAGELIAIDSPDELKRKTFGDSLYRLRPRHKNARPPNMNVVDIWQPYGANYHLRFQDDVYVAPHLRSLKKDGKLCKFRHRWKMSLSDWSKGKTDEVLFMAPGKCDIVQRI